MNYETEFPRWLFWALVFGVGVPAVGGTIVLAVWELKTRIKKWRQGHGR